MPNIDQSADDLRPQSTIHTMDTITGTSGDDNLLGTGGADRIDGLDGNDIITALGGADTIKAGAGTDFVSAGSGDDSVFGGEGDDYLKGGDGNDTLNGGVGFDRVGYLGAATGVHVDLNLQGEAQDTGQGMDVLANIEALSGTQFADVLTGDGKSNILTGSGGADLLDGGGGADLFAYTSGDGVTLIGGAGNDAVQLDSNGAQTITATHVDLQLTGAQDTGAGELTFDSIESLSGSTTEQSADTFLGSEGANTLAGATGDDVLTGRGGADLLLGDGSIDGNSELGFSAPIELLKEGDGAGADSLDGGAGKDVLIGGGGADELTGGGGVDHFVFLSTGDSNAETGVDLITDLASKDVVDLSAVDADTTSDGDQAFHLVGGFTGHAGELVRSYDAGPNLTHFQMDVDGDGQADMQIDIAGDQHDFANFVL